MNVFSGAVWLRGNLRGGDGEAVCGGTGGRAGLVSVFAVDVGDMGLCGAVGVGGMEGVEVRVRREIWETWEVTRRNGACNGGQRAARKAVGSMHESSRSAFAERCRCGAGDSIIMDGVGGGRMGGEGKGGKRRGGKRRGGKGELVEVEEEEYGGMGVAVV